MATLFGTMDRTLCLLQMGFTEKEVSSAIDKFGKGELHIVERSVGI